MRKLKPANSNRGSKKGTTLKQAAKQRQGGPGTEEGTSVGILGYFDSVDKVKRQQQKEGQQRGGGKSMEDVDSGDAGLVGNGEEEAVGEQGATVVKRDFDGLNESENMPPMSQDVLMDAGQVVWRNSPVQDPVRVGLEENEGSGHPSHGGSGQSVGSHGTTLDKALNKKKFLESRPVIEHSVPGGSLSDDLGNIDDVLQSMSGLVPSTRRRGTRLSTDGQTPHRSHHRLSVERSMNVVDSVSSVTTSFAGQSVDAGRVRGVGVTPQMKRSRAVITEKDGSKHKKSTSLALMKCCDALQSKLDNLGEKRTRKATQPGMGQRAQSKDTPSTLITRDLVSGKADIIEEIIEKAMNTTAEPTSGMEHKVDMNAVHAITEPDKLKCSSFQPDQKAGDWGDDEDDGEEDDELLGALDAMEAAMIKERSMVPQTTNTIASECQTERFKRSIIHHTVVSMSRACTPDGFPEVILKVKNGCSKVCSCIGHCNARSRQK